MSYQAVETSREGAEPIELFEFVGTNNTYRFTSYNEQISFQGFDYLPIAISRRAIKYGSNAQDEVAIEVALPYNETVAFEYIFAAAPPELRITIYRVHASNNITMDAITLWRGRVTSTNVKGREAVFRVPTIFGYLFNTNAPSVRYQSPCNHRLFDARCKVNEALNSFTADVLSINGNFVQLDAIAAGFEGTDLVGGTIQVDGDVEARLIVGQTGTTIETAYPFSNAITAGTTLQLKRGCNRAINGDCLNKFNNVANFGGFVLVPPKNPFEGNVT